MTDAEQVDVVHAPPHYRQGEIEAIDAIRSALGPEGFRAFCRGTAMAYLWRAPYKGTEATDYAKADFYVRRLISETHPPEKEPSQ